jgi:hypothetical protein
VRQTVTLALRQEAETFALRFSCEDCCHGAIVNGEPSCSLGFPADLRRDALAGEELAFCKSFELA